LGEQGPMGDRLAVGLGGCCGIGSALVDWGDGRFQSLKGGKANQRVVLGQNDGAGIFDYSIFHKKARLLKNVDSHIPYRHFENKFVEFNREALIPHMFSAEGPAAAVADFNNDGKDDLFLGGAKWKVGSLMTQTPKGEFIRTSQPAVDADSVYEDVDATFFDADGDKDLDLFVVSGGNEFSGQSEYRNSRLYLINGKGNFSKSTFFAQTFNTGSCVAVNDIDGDGDLDIFLGTRTIPWRYGIKPDSYVLLNDGAGK